MSNNPNLKDQNKLLDQLNDWLSMVEKEKIQKFNIPKMAISYILGAPRSSTTLISQIMAKTGKFGYISNYSAKFWLAPFIGLMQEYAMDLRNTSKIGYTSNYGLTDSLAEPHEFTYFWDRWFLKDETHQMSPEMLETVDFSTMLQELHAIESVYQLPLFFKNLRLNFYITKLNEIFDKSNFIICLRNPLYQAQSLLMGRMKKKSNIKKWYSIKPKQYKDLIKLDPYQQVVGQIFYILKSIFSQIHLLSKKKYVIIYYENFIEEPKLYLKKILKLSNISYTSKVLDKIPNKFENNNKKHLKESQIKKITKAIDHFSKILDDNMLDIYYSFYDD